MSRSRNIYTFSVILTAW